MKYAAHLLALSFALACTPSALPGDAGPGDAGPGDAGAVLLRGPCTSDRAGGFAAEILTDFSTITGRIADAPLVAANFVVESSTENCRLIRRLPPACEPACAVGTSCGVQGCEPTPNTIDIGPVRILGLDRDVTMQARPPGNNYFATDLAHPAYGPGDILSLRLRSELTGTLDLAGVGGAELSGPGDTVLTSAEPLTLSWDAPASGARTEVALRINIDLHGAAPLSLACEFDDDGEASVPAATIEALVASGVSGFPLATLTRQTFDSATTELGCIDFKVASVKSLALRVTGHTPCINDGQCPGEQICDLENETCTEIP